jgi:two-component system KDP operon response regulator KdpE
MPRPEIASASSCQWANRCREHPVQGKVVLVIEDDVFVRKAVGTMFERAGARVIVAGNGAEGLRHFFEHRPDLVTLDIMMPRTNGWETCRQIRQLANTPIIVLTSINDENAEIRALEMGAIDYVTKPYSPNVLLARSRAALRQVTPGAEPTSAEAFSDGYLSVDLNGRRLTIMGEPIRLTKTEFDLLAYLVRNRGMVLTFDQILDSVWGAGYDSNTDYVHVYMSRLRKKIERDAKQPAYLITIHGLGYMFEG